MIDNIGFTQGDFTQFELKLESEVKKDVRVVECYFSDKEKLKRLFSFDSLPDGIKIKFNDIDPTEIFSSDKSIKIEFFNSNNIKPNNNINDFNLTISNLRYAKLVSIEDYKSLQSLGPWLLFIIGLVLFVVAIGIFAYFKKYLSKIVNNVQNANGVSSS